VLHELPRGFLEDVEDLDVVVDASEVPPELVNETLEYPLDAIVNGLASLVEQTELSDVLHTVPRSSMASEALAG
jgi:hypothetical protein